MTGVLTPSYSGTSVQQLMADFKADIERLRGEQHD